MTNERVSDVKQADGVSIEQQQGTLLDFCSKNMFNVVAQFSEQASGYKGTRKTIEEAYTFCKRFNAKNKANPVQYFISLTSDRYFRNIELHYHWSYMFKQIGVEIQFADNWDFGDDASIFSRAIDAAKSEAFSRSNSYHTLRNQYAWAERGKPCPKPPRGIIRYVNPNDKHDFDHTLNECGLKTVKAIRMIALGAVPLNLYNTMGKAKTFGSRSQFFENIRNLMFALKYFLDGTKIGKESKIVDVYSSTPDDFCPYHIFQEAQRRMNANAKNKAGTKHAAKFPLKGVIGCSLCDHNFSTSTPKGRNGVFYYYSIKKGYCNNMCGRNSTRIQSKYIEPSVERMISDLEIFGPDREELNGIIKKNQGQHKRDITIKIDGLKEELATLRNRQQRALELILDGSTLITEQQKIDIDNKVLEAESNVARLEATYEMRQQVTERAIRFLSNLGELYRKSDNLTKNAMLKTIFPAGLTVEVESATASPVIFRTARINKIFELIGTKPDGYKFLIIDPPQKMAKKAVLGDSLETSRTVYEDISLFNSLLSQMGMVG